MFRIFRVGGGEVKKAAKDYVCNVELFKTNSKGTTVSEITLYSKFKSSDGSVQNLSSSVGFVPVIYRDPLFQISAANP